MLHLDVYEISEYCKRDSLKYRFILIAGKIIFEQNNISFIRIKFDFLYFTDHSFIAGKLLCKMSSIAKVLLELYKIKGYTRYTYENKLLKRYC